MSSLGSGFRAKFGSSAEFGSIGGQYGLLWCSVLVV